MSRRNTDTFKKEIFALVGDEYEIIGEYVNNKKPIEAIHHSHSGDHIFKMYPKNFLIGGTRCPICAKNSKKDISYIQNFLDLRGDNITVLDKFYRARKSGRKYAYLTLQHNVCNRTFTVAMSNILNVGTGCPYCCKNRKITPDVFNDMYVNDITDGEYTLLTEEVYGSETKIEMKHNKCGNTFITSVHNFNNGCRCPICRSSKNEKIIFDFLKENNLDFVHQWTPENFKNGKNSKKFDFYIPSKKLVIEYDGEFHYLPVFGYEYLEKTKERDIEKDNYCRLDNINMLRIPFWESERIKEILNKVLFNNDISVSDEINNLEILDFNAYKSENRLRKYKCEEEDVLYETCDSRISNKG